MSQVPLWSLYHRTGFECKGKQLWMVLYKPDCDSNDCNLPKRQATPSSSSAILRHDRRIVLSLFTLLVWFPNYSGSNAAVTAWFTPLRTSGDSCAWLGVGRFTFDLKDQCIYQRSTVEHDCIVQQNENTYWVFKQRSVVTCYIIHCIYFFLRSLDCEVWKNS